MNIKIEDNNIIFLTIYGPNSGSPDFYDRIGAIIEEFDNQTVNKTGDYN